VHTGVLVGVALALACAVAASLGGLWKHKGAVETRDVDIRQPLCTGAALFRSKWFLVGWIVAVVAWLLHVGALALAPLALAQAVIAGGLVALGVLAERFFGFELQRRQWAALGVVALGMAVLGATAHSESNRASYAIPAIVAFELSAIALGLTCAAACRSARLGARRGVLLGAAAGFLFGVSDVSIKAVTTGTHGLLGVLGPWTALGVLTAIAAFYASARSLQIGNGVSVLAATAAAANTVGISAGVVVFGEGLGSDIVTIVGRVSAFVLVVVAAGLMPAPVRAHEATAERSGREAQLQDGHGGDRAQADQVVSVDRAREPDALVG
jgi:fucose 4-O-acetylase-like acetyltransferase